MRSVQVAKQSREGRFMERNHTGEDSDCEEFLAEALDQGWELVQDRVLTLAEVEEREARKEWVAFMNRDFSVPDFSEVKVGDSFRLRSERELIVGGFWPLITALEFYCGGMTFCYGKARRGQDWQRAAISLDAGNWSKLVAAGDIRHQKDPSLPKLY